MDESRRSLADSAGAFSSLSLRQQRAAGEAGALGDGVLSSDDGVPVFSVAGFTGALGDGDPSCDGGRWSAPRLTDDVGALMVFGRVVHQLEGWTLGNDGIVPAASARYGIFLGCVAADHVDWLGWHENLPGRPAPFDEVAFARVLVNGLEAAAREGAPAMEAFVPHLAALAHAHPR